jgi:hypothetical protein
LQIRLKTNGLTNLKQHLYINSSCTISKSTVSKNGQPLFDDANTIDVQQFLTNAYKHFELNYPRFYKMDGLSKLGWLAAELLLQNKNINQKYAADEVCVLLMNSSSSLDTDRKYFDTISKMASPALFVYTLPNIVMGEICIRHGFKGETSFFIEPGFRANFLEQQVRLVMQPAANKACICGWVELLDSQYKTTLWLVEKNNATQSVSFTAENIQTTF